MSDAALYLLLIASLVVSCLLLMVALPMVGRQLTYREYQKARGINGTRLIQSTVNIRTHAMRALVGITFGVFAILLLSDAPMLWRQWVNRLLFVLLPLGYLTASCLDWIAERQQLRHEMANEAEAAEATATLALVAEQARTAMLRADHDSYKEMAAEAIASLAVVAHRVQRERGEDVTPTLVPVVPEHSSPVSPEQQAEANRSTLRADLVASKLALGLPTREAPAPDAPQIIVPESVDVVTIQAGAVKSIADAVADAMPEQRR